MALHRAILWRAPGVSAAALRGVASRPPVPAGSAPPVALPEGQPA
jgi:hypothetical protein